MISSHSSPAGGAPMCVGEGGGVLSSLSGVAVVHSSEEWQSADSVLGASEKDTGEAEHDVCVGDDAGEVSGDTSGEDTTGMSKTSGDRGSTVAVEGAASIVFCMVLCCVSC